MRNVETKLLISIFITTLELLGQALECVRFCKGSRLSQSQLIATWICSVLTAVVPPAKAQPGDQAVESLNFTPPGKYKCHQALMYVPAPKNTSPTRQIPSRSPSCSLVAGTNEFWSCHVHNVTETHPPHPARTAPLRSLAWANLLWGSQQQGIQEPKLTPCVCCTVYNLLNMFYR